MGALWSPMGPLPGSAAWRRPRVIGISAHDLRERVRQELIQDIDSHRRLTQELRDAAAAASWASRWR